MKNILIAASIAALMSGSAMAQTSATTPAPASDNPVIVVLPPVTQGAAPAHFLIDDLDDEDVRTPVVAHERELLEVLHDESRRALAEQAQRRTPR